jgi:GNAT superfamily N-acetyltransferase
MLNLNEAVKGAYTELLEGESFLDSLTFTTDINGSIEKQARMLDKESKLLISQSDKDVVGAYMLGEELVGAVWAEWDEWREGYTGPEYAEGFDKYSSDIAVFEKYQGKGVGKALVSQSHAYYESTKGKYNNPKAIIEVKSQSVLEWRKALGYVPVDQNPGEVIMVKE